MPVKKLFIVAVIAVFSVAGVPPSATVVGSNSAYAAQTTRGDLLGCNMVALAGFSSLVACRRNATFALQCRKRWRSRSGPHRLNRSSRISRTVYRPDFDG